MGGLGFGGFIFRVEGSGAILLGVLGLGFRFQVGWQTMKQWVVQTILCYRFRVQDLGCGFRACSSRCRDSRLPCLPAPAA